MPTTIWTGSISFGLVTVPVKLTPATKSRDVSFNQLEESTGSRIRLRRVSEQTGEEVTPNQIVKGYEIEKGRYVVVEKSELDALAPKASHTIEIEDFVDLDEIDPLYFDSPYYVIPDEKAAKPYRASEIYEVGERIDHPSFGQGVIEISEPGKITVFFGSGRRVLVQAKAPVVGGLARPKPFDHSNPPAGGKPVSET